MIGLGLSLNINLVGAGGGAAPALAAIGSQIGIWSDGVMSEGACPGARNAFLWTLSYLNGRCLPAPGYMQGKSGGDMNTCLARLPYTTVQMWDIAVMGSMGHNDGLMNTDPDLDPTNTNLWKSNLIAFVAANPNAKYIPVCSTLPSQVGGETQAIYNKVWAIQQAAVTACADARVFYVATGEAFNPATMIAGGGDTAHPNVLGGYTAGYLTIGPAIGAKIVAGSIATIQGMLQNTIYPGLSGGQLYSTNTLVGVAGSKAGTVVPTGEVATSHTLTNNLTNGTSVTVLASKSPPDPATPSTQVIDISGTPSAQNTVIFGTTATISVTGSTPGQYALFAATLTFDDGTGAAPVGLVQFSADFGNFGIHGSSGALAGAGADIGWPTTTLMMVPPKPFFGGNGPFAASPRVLTRHSVINNDVEKTINSPTLHLISTRSQSPAQYIGGDSITGANYLLRLTGTLASGVGTLRVEPGAWCPYGLTNADFSARRIYKGSSATIGSGTLVATLTGATWTWTTSGISGGDTLWAEVDAISGTGSTHTERSATAYTAS